MALQTDYLIKGGGASAMGFLDAMFHHSRATFTIVDRNDAPGGHWNHGYPFVRLINLPSGAQVADHYQRAMEEVFRPSGRVDYHPMSELNDDGEIVSLLTGRRQRVEVRRRVVDATHLETAIPLTHRRSFEVAAEVRCIPPNDLPRLAPGHARFVVIGGGKTGLDCVSWLLDRGAEPAAITWVISRDAWWSNRRALQSAGTLRSGSLEMLCRQSEVMATASSVATASSAAKASSAAAGASSSAAGATVRRLVARRRADPTDDVPRRNGDEGGTSTTRSSRLHRSQRQAAPDRTRTHDPSGWLHRFASGSSLHRLLGECPVTKLP